MTGRLEVITGPMFSGKTEELIRRLRRAQIAGKKVIAFKPSLDSRYEVENIASHNGTTFKCVPTTVSGIDIKKGSEGYDVVGIDEAQFFNYRLQKVVESLLNQGTTVILAGLDMTYRQEPWKTMPYFMAIAESVDKFSAVCHKCGDDAMYTQRLIGGKPAPFAGDTVVVGGLDSYEARCRACFQAR